MQSPLAVMKLLSIRHLKKRTNSVATLYLIIDGYNLMHAAGIARRSYGPGDLERCRTQLNRLLKDLLGRDAISRASVVYDAFDSTSDANRSQDQGGLHVLFAPKGTDADTEIERLLNQHSSPKQVLVVSSDHRLHKAARRRKAACVDSEEFLAGVQTSAETNTRKPQRTPPEEIISRPAADKELQAWAEKLERIEDECDPASDVRQPPQRQRTAEDVPPRTAEKQLQSWADDFERGEDQSGPTTDDGHFPEQYLKEIQRELDDRNLP